MSGEVSPTPRELAVNTVNALNALRAALAAARKGGVHVILNSLQDGQSIDITKGLLDVRFHQELYPFEERPSFAEGT